MSSQRILSNLDHAKGLGVHVFSAEVDHDDDDLVRVVGQVDALITDVTYPTQAGRNSVHASNGRCSVILPEDGVYVVATYTRANVRGKAKTQVLRRITVVGADDAVVADGFELVESACPFARSWSSDF